MILNCQFSDTSSYDPYTINMNTTKSISFEDSDMHREPNEALIQDAEALRWKMI